MVVNFRAHEISRGARKLAQITTLKKKKELLKKSSRNLSHSLTNNYGGYLPYSLRGYLFSLIISHLIIEIIALTRYKCRVKLFTNSRIT